MLWKNGKKLKLTPLEFDGTINNYCTKEGHE